MHCDAEFDGPVDESDWTGSAASDDHGRDWGSGDDSTAVSNWGSGDEPTAASSWGDSDQTAMEDDSGWADTADATGTDSVESRTTESVTPDTTADYGTTGGESSGDRSSTVVGLLSRIAAVVLTVVVGLLTTFVLVAAAGEMPSLWLPLVLVGLVGICAGGVVIARQDTGIDALADALYVTAAAVVALPFFFSLLIPSNDPIVERLIGGLIFAFFGAFVGGPLYVIGWWLQPNNG